MEGNNIIFSYFDLNGRIQTDINILNKIKSFANLPIGWDFGQGMPPNQEVIKRSLELYNYGTLEGFKGNARPSPHGGIVISLFSGDSFFYITINPDISFDFRYEKGIGEVYEILDEKDNSSFEYIDNFLKSIKEQWFLSALYTSKNTMKIVNDSQVIHSKYTGMEFLSLLKNAQETPAGDQFVIISQDFTPELQGIQ